LGSCKYLVLKPPKKDFIKMLENEHKVLRFVARMVRVFAFHLTKATSLHILISCPSNSCMFI
jgi:hypothetical protein